MLLQNKVALITDCNKGIGKAIMEKFASEGSFVFANSRTKGSLDSAAAELSKKYNTAVQPVYFDVTDKEGIKQCIMTIKKQCGKLDILVNNAGTMKDAWFKMVDYNSLQQTFETNADAVIYLTQMAVKLMKKAGCGSIINVVSIADLNGNKTQTDYFTSKVAVATLIKTCAQELCGNNIRVNALIPGNIDTDLFHQIREDKQQEIISHIGFKRLGKPDEIANGALFFASELSTYVTGQVMVIDGGEGCKRIAKVQNNCDKSLPNKIRKEIIEQGMRLGNTGMHFGPTLSLVEIMCALYFNVMKYKVEKPAWAERDRLILSKGHGVLAQYLVMKEVGFLRNIDINTFKNDFSILSAHPSRHPEIGIDFSSGSLGHGLSLGVGVALALKKKYENPPRVFVVLGDGELDEGSVWEAVMSATKFNLNNLVAVVDKNSLQYDGSTTEIMNIDPLNSKFDAYNWDVTDIDGHNIDDLSSALNSSHTRPLCVIAHTVKGKGFSFMENKPEWHNKSLTKELYSQALSELEADA